MLVIAIILGFLGLCFGSFVNALVWRLHKKKDWVKERSQCVHCGHELAAKDLIPVLSWLMLRGRCRYCRRRISAQYPLVELIAAAVFVLSYVYWPQSLQADGQIVLFVTWLACSIGLLALAVYDWRWMLLPNNLIYPTLVVAVAGRAFFLIGYEADKGQALIEWAAALAAASGLFWVIYQMSKGKYIGYGDVRLGLITGTLLATPLKGFLMIFFASVFGTLYALPSLINSSRKLSAKIPYGPFLILAAFFTVLFGQSIADWYQRLLT